tara:strand:- start:1115 stop:1633 length:519 start_codon:yes stop_codon:yes gene_type:complete
MSDNHFFAEQELCNGRMNDKIVDKALKKREPKHWSAKRTRTETLVVERKGIVARVESTVSADAAVEACVVGGHDLLDGLSPEERRALLDEAPTRAMPPPASEEPESSSSAASGGGGLLSFSSRRQGVAAANSGAARRGKKRPLLGERSAAERGSAVRTSGPLSFADDEDCEG